MKIRTKNELKDILDKDFGWRIKELSYLLLIVKHDTGKALGVSLRSSILLLYAHWEGFIKNAAMAYLNFVKNQNLTYEELVNCFVAVSLKQKIKEFEATNKSTIHTQFITYLKNSANVIASLNESVISTASNLNSSILKEILTTIGIDFSPFELKSNLIDEQLLNYRNTIAHGEFLTVDKKEYNQLHLEVFAMMKSIKNDIENAAAMTLYRA